MWRQLDLITRELHVITIQHYQSAFSVLDLLLLERGRCEKTAQNYVKFCIAPQTLISHCLVAEFEF